MVETRFIATENFNCVPKNHDARLEQVENTISVLGTFGNITASFGMFWMF